LPGIEAGDGLAQVGEQVEHGARLFGRPLGGNEDVGGPGLAVDAEDGGDVIVPVGSGKPVGGMEDGDGAAFVAVAAGVVAMGGAERGCGGGNVLDLLVQGRLVVLDLDDQGDAGFGGDLEMFF
jgi:hypothetical protein